MKALLKKELWTYFGTFGAYLIALLFVVVAALFLWYLDNDYNVFLIGNADAKSFFQLCPWLLLFLIPALTMRSFAEEFSLGTLQWLFSKPIELSHIILGKFLAFFILVVFILLPTTIFIYTIYQLSIPVGNIDLGVVFSGYFGLILLSLSFISIGIFCSVLTKNVVYSFLLSVFLNFIFFFGFEKIASFDLFGTFDYWVKKIGFASHFSPFTNGLIDTRDIAYFLLIISFFMFSTHFSLKKLK